MEYLFHKLIPSSPVEKTILKINKTLRSGERFFSSETKRFVTSLLPPPPPHDTMDEVQEQIIPNVIYHNQNLM
jgi:hypothetical protein